MNIMQLEHTQSPVLEFPIIGNRNMVMVVRLCSGRVVSNLCFLLRYLNKCCGKNTGSHFKNSYRAQAKPVLYSGAIGKIQNVNKLLATDLSDPGYHSV
jgi:hypothetical protein